MLFLYLHLFLIFFFKYSVRFVFRRLLLTFVLRAFEKSFLTIPKLCFLNFPDLFIHSVNLLIVRKMPAVVYFRCFENANRSLLFCFSRVCVHTGAWQWYHTKRNEMHSEWSFERQVAESRESTRASKLMPQDSRKD